MLLGSDRYQPIARQLLESGIERSVAHAVKKSYRILKTALEIIAGHLGIHQEAENRKFHVDTRRSRVRIDSRHPIAERFQGGLDQSRHTSRLNISIRDKDV